MEILIGADPEIFVKRDGALISAHGLVEGTKESPKPVSLGAVQVDGMALEFNIDPASNEDQFVHHINTVMAQLGDMVPDCELEVVPVAHFGRDLIDAQPEEAKELGCEPDYDAYTGRENNPPNAEVPFRTAAGHVHIGFCESADIRDANHKDMCEALVRELDVYLGLASLFFDNDTVRRELYGRAGAYRPKSYGCEYRVLSNQWLADEELMRWVVRSVNAAVACLMQKGGISAEIDDVADIINTSDLERAKAIINKYDLEVPNV